MNKLRKNQNDFLPILNEQQRQMLDCFFSDEGEDSLKKKAIAFSISFAGKNGVHDHSQRREFAKEVVQQSIVNVSFQCARKPIDNLQAYFWKTLMSTCIAYSKARKLNLTLDKYLPVEKQIYTPNFTTPLTDIHYMKDLFWREVTRILKDSTTKKIVEERIVGKDFLIIADTLDLTEVATRRRYARAIKKLRNNLNFNQWLLLLTN